MKTQDCVFREPQYAIPGDDPMVGWVLEPKKASRFINFLIAERIYFEANPHENQKEDFMIRVREKEWKKKR